MVQRNETLSQVWKSNISSNVKLLSAVVGDVLISMIIVLFYILNFGWNAALFTFTTLMAIKPYIIMIVSIFSKGEVKRLQIEYNLSQEREKHLRERITWEQEKNTMLSKLTYEREIAEWRVQVAALTSKPVESIKEVTNWKSKNAQIEYLLKKGHKNGYVADETIHEIAKTNGIHIEHKEKPKKKPKQGLIGE